MVKGRWGSVEEIEDREGVEFRGYQWGEEHTYVDMAEALKDYTKEQGPVKYFEMIEGDPEFNLVISKEWEPIKDTTIWNDLTDQTFDGPFPETLNEEDAVWMGMFIRDGRYTRLYMNPDSGRCWIWTYWEERPTFTVVDVESVDEGTKLVVATVKVHGEAVVLTEEIKEWCEANFEMKVEAFMVVSVSTIKNITSLTVVFNVDNTGLILKERAEWEEADSKIGNGRP